jgi:predicted membrane channel-forming protein YqfA (hemolysin III family)
MDKVLTFVVVTIVWVIISAAIGFLMKRSGKPYGVWKPAVHGLIALFIAAGTASCLIGLLAVSPFRVFSLVAISLATLGVLCNLVVGPLMLAAKAVNTKRVKIHQISAGLIALGLIGAAVFVTIKI